MSIGSSSRATGRSNSTATSSTANGHVKRYENSKSGGPSNNERKTKAISRKFIKNDELENEGEESQQDEGISTLEHHSSSNRRYSSSKAAVKPEIRPKGAKRKIAEIRSANSSANGPSHGRGGTMDVEANGPVANKVKTAGRPKKKRKVVVKAILKPEESSSRQSLGQGGKNFCSRTPQILRDIESEDGEELAVNLVGQNTNEVETDENLVEEVISEGLASPAQSARDSRPNFRDSDAEDEGSQVVQMTSSSTKGKGRVITLQEGDDEIMIVDDGHRQRHRAHSPHVISTPQQGGSNFRPNTKNTFAKIRPRWGKNKPSSNMKANISSRTLTSILATQKTVEESLIPDICVLQSEDQSGNKHVGDGTVEDFRDVDDIENSRLSPGAKRRLEIFDYEVFGKPGRANGASVKRVPESVQSPPTRPYPILKSVTNSNSKQVTTVTHEAGLLTADTELSMPPPSGHPRHGDIVPESEVEDSQSQEREIERPTTSNTDQRPTVPEVVTLLTPVTPPSNPSNLILKSRMKPRTPLLTAKAVPGMRPNSNAHHSSNNLRPLPQLSPSTFHAHLQLPNSSLPDSIIEPSSSNDRQVHEPIEEFETPEKGHRVHGNKKVVVLDRKDTAAEEMVKEGEVDTTRARGKESAEDIWDSEFVRRGKKIAEAAKAKKRSDTNFSDANYGPDVTKKKQSLEDIAARAKARSRSLSYVSRSSAEDELQEGETAGADASTSVVPPASGPYTVSQDQLSQTQSGDAHLRAMEGAHVDPSGIQIEVDGADATHDGIDNASALGNPEFNKEEEEESTQDLLEEMLQLQAQQRQVDASEVQELVTPSQDKTNNVDPSSQV